VSDAPVWSVMTRTRGGTVSLLKNLTYAEAQACMQRLRRPFDSGNPWLMETIPHKAWARAVQEKQLAESGGYYSTSGGHSWHPQDADLEQIECWGPPGKKMDVWPKPRGYDKKYVAALAEARAKLAEAPQ